MTVKSEPAGGHPVGRVYGRSRGSKSTKAVINLTNWRARPVRQIAKLLWP
jgi:hypothetical protein